MAEGPFEQCSSACLYPVRLQTTYLQQEQVVEIKVHADGQWSVLQTVTTCRDQQNNVLKEITFANNSINNWSLDCLMRVQSIVPAGYL